MRRIGRFILRGPLQAILVAGILGGVAQMMFLLALPAAAAVALFVLRKGEPQGFSVLLGASLLSVATGMLVESRPGFDYPVALLLIFPVYVGARVLRTSESQGFAIASIAACFAAFALAMQLYFGDAAQWWNEWLMIAAQSVPGESYDNFQNGVMPVINGLVAMFLGMLCSACLLWARWLQAALFKPRGFGREFRAITLPLPSRNLYVLLAILAVAALIRLALLYDLLLVAVMPLFFQGLAVLQHSAEKRRLNKFLTALPYVLLLLMPQFVISGCAFLGGVDMFFNFRKLARKKP